MPPLRKPGYVPQPPATGEGPLPQAAMLPRVWLPPRQAILGGQTEVLVVGGGPAGLGAAYGAATAGARVILAERYGFLGGNATAALVMPLTSFHTQGPIAEPVKTRLLPNDHGPGAPVIAGALQVFLERLIHAGGVIPPSLETGYVVPFDPEIFKLTALDLLDEAGVPYLLHAFASGIIDRPMPPAGEEKAVADYRLPATDNQYVVFETKSGPLVIGANVVIDCTGKGTVLRRLPPGAAYDIPLRCLLPRIEEGEKVRTGEGRSPSSSSSLPAHLLDYLLVAGRCISGTHEASSSYRSMPASIATGQAAGVCAALATRAQIRPRDVPAADSVPAG